MSDKQEYEASTPAFFHAGIYQNGQVKILKEKGIGEKGITGWLQRNDHRESINDGFDHLVIRPEKGSHPEFPLETSVYYVNGINTDIKTEMKDALAYAKKTHHDVQIIHASTHGLASDFEQAFGEKESAAQAWNNAPEQSVAMEVLRRITHDGDGLRFHEGDIHFAAHSRGGLIIERGLEFVREHLRQLKYSDEQIKGIFAHVTVMTFEGASYTMPDGVRAVHCANAEDLVSEAFGAGRIDHLLLAYMQGNASELPTYLPIRPADNFGDAIPVLNLPYEHDARYSIEHSPPFEQAYQEQERRIASLHHLAERIELAVKSGVRDAMMDGQEVGEARAQERIFQMLSPNDIRATLNGKEIRYQPGGLNAKAVVSELDDKYVTLQTDGGSVIMLNHGDLLRNAKNAPVLEKVLHEVYQAGHSLHLNYTMSGKVDGVEINQALYHGHSIRRGM